ncbi:hypothetical protein C1893_10330 [Pseudomonas sp. MPR-ANC1]|nr:hypothetical protein C1893_10330 [Pseudomonas sp. MPR-ANC1]
MIAAVGFDHVTERGEGFFGQRFNRQCAHAVLLIRILLIVPTLCVVTPPWTLRVRCDAERHGMHSHAERGNDHCVVI